MGDVHVRSYGKLNGAVTAMKTTIKAAAAAGLFILILFPGCAQRQTNKANLRLLYWNIQNGMWSGQGDNYTRFVNWVSAQNPDVCVWCESVTNYKTASDEKIRPEEAYLPEHWGELARRYGHEYWYKGGHRDNFPQVITSKYPIENVARLIGAVPDSIVSPRCGMGADSEKRSYGQYRFAAYMAAGLRFRSGRQAGTQGQRRGARGRQVSPHGDRIRVQPYDRIGCRCGKSNYG